MSCVMMPSRGSAARKRLGISTYRGRSAARCSSLIAERIEFARAPSGARGRPGTYRVNQHLDRQACVTEDFHLRGIVPAQLARVNIDVDEPLRHRQAPVHRALRAQLAADDDADLAPFERGDDGGIGSVEGVPKESG